MIPKIIHYVWIGGKSIPPKFQRYIDRWNLLLPEWEFRRWDESNFDMNSSAFLKKAYAHKKWAFASDYIRIKVLYENGGIYLDTDEELLQPLDIFLSHDAFWGLEPGLRMQAGVFGCSKQHPILEKILSYYDKLDFIWNNATIPLVIGDHIYKILKEENPSLTLREDIIHLPNNMTIYPSHYFCPDLASLNIDENSYTIHHPMGSWLPFRARIRKIIYTFFVSNRVFRWIYRIIKR